MPHGVVTEMMPASSSIVFDLLHDYSRRLEWDTLLQAAYLDDSCPAAGLGVIATCKGRKLLGGITLRTVYVSFQRPTLTAVKMINTPPLFQSWAASIRHEDISPHTSQITYKFHFKSRPGFLQGILDPILQRIFLWETRRRLLALKAYLSGAQI